MKPDSTDNYSNFTQSEYTQDWKAYNNAQTSEKVRFKRLVSDLLEVVAEKESSGRGRKGHNIRTKVFTLLLQTYTGKSSRRVVSEIEEAEDQGLVDETPHFNSVLNFYQNKNLPELLKKLISITAKPLAEVEQDFTVDSSGFSTEMYEDWNHAKYQKPDEMRKFLKAHIMSGVKTNVITAVRVTEGPSGDSPEFSPLVERTAEHFEIREVSADKAYSARENLETVEKNGGKPFIPFKENATCHARGARIWRKMYDYFYYHKEEFMNHYHKRSNAETVFAMLKRKLGMQLRNEKSLSQKNEILLKCLAHNIIVLIHEMFELGIEIDFNFCAESVLAQK